MREPGFYWVRRVQEQDWTVAQVCADGKIYVVGWTPGMNAEWLEWGPRIDPPQPELPKHKVIDVSCPTCGHCQSVPREFDPPVSLSDIASGKQAKTTVGYMAKKAAELSPQKPVWRCLVCRKQVEPRNVSGTDTIAEDHYVKGDTLLCPGSGEPAGCTLMSTDDAPASSHGQW